MQAKLNNNMETVTNITSYVTSYRQNLNQKNPVIHTSQMLF